MSKQPGSYPSDYKRKQSPTEYWAEKHLGSMGKMVGSSKSIYSYNNPQNLIVFNANLASQDKGKFWFGDLDITKDHQQLKTLVAEIGPFYIFSETDLRFTNESNPDFNKALGLYDKSGWINVSLFVELEKNEDGSVFRKKVSSEHWPLKESQYENQAQIFTEIEIPDVSRFIAKPGISGWTLFQEALVKMHGLEKMKKVYPNLYITKEDNDKIEKITERGIKKQSPHLHPVKVEQFVAFDSLNLSCRDFHIDPSWAKSKTGYLKKVKNE